MNSRNTNLIAFALICGAITWYDLKKCHRLPWPPRFVFAAITFLFMELVGLVDERLGAVTSIGFVIAIYMKILAPPKEGSGFWTDCGQQVGTSQPQNTAFMSGLGQNQPPSVSSISEFQQTETTQQQSTGIPGPAPAVPPGTSVM
jgi:hypothetical protein